MPAYACDHCGACCEGRLIVEADDLDILREARLIRADPYHSGKPVAQVLHELRCKGKAVLIAGPRPCLFLGDDQHCTIYPTRPAACVAMQAGDVQCQEARLASGLPPLPALKDAEDEPSQVLSAQS
jgi:Fe-S-cluster containining protein